MDLNHGGLEQLVMTVVWDYSDEFDGLMSVTQVWDRLNTIYKSKKWAYTTVKTILDRLVTKSLLKRIKCGKKFVYSAVTPKIVMAEKALNKVAEEYFSGDYTEMAKLVENLATNRSKSRVHVFIR